LPIALQQQIQRHSRNRADLFVQLEHPRRDVIVVRARVHFSRLLDSDLVRQSPYTTFSAISWPSHTHAAMSAGCDFHP
jgi:hypothetical protein